MINHHSSGRFKNQNLRVKIILRDHQLQLSCFMDEELRPRERKKTAPGHTAC